MKSMKIASIVTAVIFTIFAILLLVQIWIEVMPWEIFIKLAITAGVIVVVTFGVAMLYREYIEEKMMKEEKYLD